MAIADGVPRGLPQYHAYLEYQKREELVSRGRTLLR